MPTSKGNNVTKQLTETESKRTTFYLQVEPAWTQMYAAEPVLKGCKAVALSQTMPKSPRGGTVLVKLTLEIPSAAFLPLVPQTVVVVPENMTAATPIEVAVEEPV